jgi:hypothetical protein
VRTPFRCLVALAATLLLGAPAAAQFKFAQGGVHSANGISLPPDGGNQRSTITQGLGLVKVTIDYSSPHVHTAAGVDRRGKIFGKDNLVGYGMTNLIFGSCPPECPWRAGANENTTLTTDHDITIQGQRLAAGTYALFMLPEPEEWTLIFSKTSSAWGSFYYDPKQDALRVKAKAMPSEYHEDLTYEFRDRQLDSATAVLKWEDVQVPFTIKVENMTDLYAQKIGEELHNRGGFDWRGWATATQFLLTHNSHLDEALEWAQHGIDGNYGGQENVTTLFTLSVAQDLNGKHAEAKATLAKALHDPTATPLAVHSIGREFMAMNRNQDALEVFQANAKMHPSAWPVHFGLARCYAAMGRKSEAIAEAKLSLPQAPDEPNRNAVKAFIASLEAAKSGS